MMGGFGIKPEQQGSQQGIKHGVILTVSGAAEKFYKAYELVSFS